jgi:ADP-heptose:LPS heptosyltransferase
MGSMLLWVSLPTWLAIAWRKTLATIRPEAKRAPAPKNIIVFRLTQPRMTGACTPLFRELEAPFFGAHCIVVVRPQYKSILAANPNVDGILSPREIGARWLPARARWLATALWFYWTQLRHRRFDLAISPRWDVDDSLATMLCVMTTAQRRVGYSTQVSLDKREVNRGFDRAFDVLVPPEQLQHEVDRNWASPKHWARR